MILYTVMPHEYVFNTPWKVEDESEQNQEFLSFEDRLFLCRKKNPYSYEIVQMLSTNPNDFLLEKYQPGQEISFFQKKESEPNN